VETYDIVTVGGGLGGSALAKAMAERGARVLVVEREALFKDRVRGEALSPWGVADAKALGLFEPLRDRCGHMLRYWNVYAGGKPVVSRDLCATTPQQAGWLTYFHPDMQEVVLQSARAAGAEIRRSVHVRALEPGSPTRVTIEEHGRREEVAARLVIGADGRASKVRRWGGFEPKHDPPKLLFAGLLLDGVAAPRDVFYHVAAPGMGLTAYVFPQAADRSRCYFGWHKDTQLARLQGAHDVERFRTASEQIGMPREFFAEAKPAGPLATFDGADSWVDHPYANGVALIGDAAATSDPTWGQGMSLTLRDVRVLCDALVAERDWDKAGHAYAAEHDRHYGIVHRCDGWFSEVFMEVGRKSDAIRARALPLLAADPSRFLETPHCGPEAPHDESARRRFYGED
jgi:2-polyprenyl-6-methoxyphenol hydroxylase-like FAD-dependent oxidoreductase